MDWAPAVLPHRRPNNRLALPQGIEQPQEYRTSSLKPPFVMME